MRSSFSDCGHVRWLVRRFTNLERAHGVSSTITARKSIWQKLNNLFWLCKHRWWMERFYRFSVRAYFFLILSIVARVYWISIASWKKRNWITTVSIAFNTNHNNNNEAFENKSEKWQDCQKCDHYKFNAFGSFVCAQLFEHILKPITEFGCVGTKYKYINGVPVLFEWLSSHRNWKRTFSVVFCCAKWQCQFSACGQVGHMNGNKFTEIHRMHDDEHFHYQFI